MTETVQCPGSGRVAQPGMGRPICPVCHRTRAIGLPGKYRRKLIVPNHDLPTRESRS